MADGSDGASRLEHAERLWAILDDYEAWPGRTLVGEDGARAGWLVAQGAIDDVGLQRRCLEMLELAVALGDADPVHLAYLHDRVLMNDGRDQLYGSQFVLAADGDLEAWPVDDPVAVDARRARLGLVSFAEHAATMRARWREEHRDCPDAASVLRVGGPPAVPRGDRPVRSQRFTQWFEFARAVGGADNPKDRAVALAHAEVVDRPHVEPSELEHQEHLGGPAADPAHRRELLHDLVVG